MVAPIIPKANMTNSIIPKVMSDPVASANAGSTTTKNIITMNNPIIPESISLDDIHSPVCKYLLFFCNVIFFITLI